MAKNPLAPLGISAVSPSRARQLRLVQVEDPERPGETSWAQRKDDVLERMSVHRHIDLAQFNAGRKLEGYYLTLQSDDLKSPDLTRPRVDGGAPRNTPAQKTQEAAANIRKIESVLGELQTDLVRAVIARGQSITDWAADRGYHSDFEKRFAGKLFRESMEIVAAKLNLVPPVQ